MARRLRLLLALVAVVVGATLVVAPGAGAETSTRVDDHGWWWRVQTGALTELPPPPGVDDGQLLVQSTPEGPQAIAAVSAVLAEGQRNPVLTLDVAADGGGAAAVILACHAGSAWNGEDAGRWDSRPKADCSTSVTGLPTEDGSQWTFALGPLQFDDRFNVVLVPGVLADSEAFPTFSVTFEEPTATSIETATGAAPPAVSVPPATSPPTSSAATAEPARGGSSFTPPRPAPAPTVASTPPTTAALPARPALGADDQGRTDTAPVVRRGEQAAALPDAPAETRTLARIVGVGVLLAGLGGAVATRRSAAVAGAAATADAPVLGGLARFRTERSSEPAPVS